MALLTRIEEILSIPMEAVHNRRGFQPVDLTRRAVRSMEQGARKGIHKTYAPNRFHVLLSPVDYEELYPFLAMICSDIRGELRRIVEERDYLLAGELQVDVLMDESTETGKPEIKGCMVSDDPLDDEPAGDSRGPHDRMTETTALRDAGTVIMLPNEAPPQPNALETGISLLKAGHARDALTVLSESEATLVDQPEYHAAMAVALDMNQRREEALPHYRRLRALEGPQPFVQRRLEWDSRSSPSSSTVERPACSIRLGSKDVELLNPDLNTHIRVDGKVAPVVALQPGSEIRIGGLVLRVANT